MPINLSDLRKKIKAVDVDFEGEKLHVTYRLGDLTPESLDKVRALLVAEDEEGIEGTTESELWGSLLSMLESWDLTDGDQPVPITVEGLQRVPRPLLQAVVKAVNEDASPNPPKRKGSRRGSFA